MASLISRGRFFQLLNLDLYCRSTCQRMTVNFPSFLCIWEYKGKKESWLYSPILNLSLSLFLLFVSPVSHLMPNVVRVHDLHLFQITMHMLAILPRFSSSSQIIANGKFALILL
ncbi:hypothetical protein K435DRAFT_401418 [Dendrothele bispora CBS 962.96]|uniref:Uncharacterized protein n=1 Tax=Dendrothele bispora (strain CBS 962.96) TaxID=1314807 RepID=A0A4S8MFL7_DENBC|nr:hypothetical protein K435DRAFT_401418 [Dendrothele bispora CBS 962.96]